MPNFAYQHTDHWEWSVTNSSEYANEGEGVSTILKSLWTYFMEPPDRDPGSDVRRLDDLIRREGAKFNRGEAGVKTYD